MSVRQTIVDCYDAYSARDLKTVMDSFSENVCYEWTASPDHSKWCGCYDGKERMVERLGALADEFDYLEFELIDLLVDGDKAASRVRMKLRNKQTGKEFTNHSGHFWTFEGNKCVHFIEYYDSALVMAHTN